MNFSRNNPNTAILKIMKISRNCHGRFTANYSKFPSSHWIHREMRYNFTPTFLKIWKIWSLCYVCRSLVLMIFVVVPDAAGWPEKDFTSLIAHIFLKANALNAKAQLSFAMLLGQFKVCLLSEPDSLKDVEICSLCGLSPVDALEAVKEGEFQICSRPRNLNEDRSWITRYLAGMLVSVCLRRGIYS